MRIKIKGAGDYLWCEVRFCEVCEEKWVRGFTLSSYVNPDGPRNDDYHFFKHGNCTGPKDQASASESEEEE